MVGVVAERHRPLRCRAGQHVQVIHIVAGRRHGRAVVAVRDQHHVAAANLGQHVDLPVRPRRIDPLVAQPVPPIFLGQLEVVDLLEHGLAGSGLVVLVWRVRRPVTARRQHLDRDELVAIEGVGGAEVVDLPGRLAGSAQLDGDVGGRAVAHRERARGGRRRQREPAARCAADDE